MAAYAGTTTLVFNTVFGDKRVSLLTVDVTNYNSSGIPLTAALAGLDTIECVIPFAAGVAGLPDHHIKYDPINSICRAFVDATVTESANDVDIGATTLFYVLVIGV